MIINKRIKVRERVLETDLKTMLKDLKLGNQTTFLKTHKISYQISALSLKKSTLKQCTNVKQIKKAFLKLILILIQTMLASKILMRIVKNQMNRDKE